MKTRQNVTNNFPTKNSDDKISPFCFSDDSIFTAFDVFSETELSFPQLS
jgi:hypothetical protein